MTDPFVCDTPAGQLSPLELLLGDYLAWHAVVETWRDNHVDTGSGVCRGCGPGAVRWPCAVAVAHDPRLQVAGGIAVAILESGPVGVATDGR